MGTALLDLRLLIGLAALAGLLATLAMALQSVPPIAPAEAAAPAAEQVESATPPSSQFAAERRVLPTSLAATPPPAPEAPAFEVLYVRPGATVPVRSTRRGRVLARLDAVTEFGSPQTLAVVARRGRWARVVTSVLSNGRSGWVRVDSRVEVKTTRVRLMLDLSARRLVLKRGDRVLRRMTVGVGRPSSPTPVGRFAVTDKLPGARYGSYYGCCIVALSAHQPHLPSGWRGGDRIAIHGTNAPGSIGAASSAGCPRASDADMRALMRRMPLGAPVFIRA
jgi:lipoprotein-anchoring transpeptidase ErfK/SrfK